MKIKILSAFFFAIFVIFASVGFAHSQERLAITVNGVGGVASCSSYCDEYQDMKFTPDQAFNGDPEKPWMGASAFNPKEGEWVKFTFTKPTGIAALRIAPGFGHTPGRFYDYSRLKKFNIVFEIPVKGGLRTETREYNRKFDGAPQKDIVLFFPNQPVVKSFAVHITEVYKGKAKSNAVIGNIEPIIIREGKMFCSSQALSDVIAFLRSSRTPDGAFAFLPYNKPILIQRVIHAANPLDQVKLIKKEGNFSRDDIRKNWEMWAEICRQIFSEYQIHSYESTNYFWQDTKSGRIFLDMNGSETADVMHSCQIEMSRQKVKETIAPKSAQTGKKSANAANPQKSDKPSKGTQIEVLKTIVDKISLVVDVYTP